MFALRDALQSLANLETAANFFNFKKIVRRFIISLFLFKSSLLWERVLGLRPDRWEQV